MENPKPAASPPAPRHERRRIRAERIETALIVALAALVLLKGAPAIAGIASGIGDMMMALARL